MAKLDPFTAEIVAYVRKMPDEVLLELVRAHLGSGGAVQLPGSSTPRRGTGRKRTKSTTPARTKTRRTAKRSTAGERTQLLSNVETMVKKSRGLSSSEVAKKLGVPQTRAAAALRELKGKRRIFQGGDRRFARYAGDAKTAKAASTRARKNASGPKNRR